MKQCIMCKQMIPDVGLDFAGRCIPCFRKYMAIPDYEKKPDLGIPWSNKTPPGA